MGPKLEQMPKREKTLKIQEFLGPDPLPTPITDWISDFRSGSILLTIRSQILWVRLLYHFRYILTEKTENKS